MRERFCQGSKHGEGEKLRTSRAAVCSWRSSLCGARVSAPSSSNVPAFHVASERRTWHRSIMMRERREQECEEVVNA